MKNKKCGGCGEDLDIARLKQEIIRMHERENHDLLDHLKSLESAIQEKKLKLLEKELDGKHKITCEYESRCKDDDGGSISLSIDVEKKDGLLRKEQGRRKQLLQRVLALEDEVRRVQRRKERERKFFEVENDTLQRKATIGWILGTLSDIVLEDKPQGGAECIMRLARKIQRELETRETAAELDRLEREVERLVDYADSRPGITLDIEGNGPQVILSWKKDHHSQQKSSSRRCRRRRCRPCRTGQ
ncbi:uncharacterized protein LOC112348301 isoform X1 [Selaginella moellendorffii]|uniref:uncharacterized protein LOC112348301 isoform X1 n=1 Tax=Selaginella moellendorffii TaxID=88036 RepID=UPI000D1D1122|nr:uncharacterized protein LOC112348301 isoform X1 [Selaginella moellendorffii]|eukprot:XP_024536330.1 uncharacterized protein LOC112348301 isoform X1 [Selaginella moellendorffii]